MTVDEAGNSSLWSREQEKSFENALATYPQDSSDWWEKIAADVSGKTLEEIKHHYELLVDDINSIESGRVPLPSYTFPSDGSKNRDGDVGTGKNGGGAGNFNAESGSGNGGKPSRLEQERRKGIAWTEEEHRLFLLGLEKYGKGDWRSISRNFVVTRTPTQVASHAQKYFIRLNSVNKDRRRSSIHDITSVDTGDLSLPQGPITGQGDGSAPALVVPASGKQPPQPTTSALGTYGGPAIGQSIAIGTPVSRHPASVGYGPPMNIGSMGFPMPSNSGKR